MSYGGGRKDHVLEAFRALVFLEDDPPTTEILIAHDTTNDSCEAMVWQKQAIDLMPLRKAFQSIEPQDDALSVDAFEVSITLITGEQNVVNIRDGLAQPASGESGKIQGKPASPKTSKSPGVITPATTQP